MQLVRFRWLRKWLIHHIIKIFIRFQKRLAQFWVISYMWKTIISMETIIFVFLVISLGCFIFKPYLKIAATLSDSLSCNVSFDIQITTIAFIWTRNFPFWSKTHFHDKATQIYIEGSQALVHQCMMYLSSKWLANVERI